MAQPMFHLTPPEPNKDLLHNLAEYSKKAKMDPKPWIPQGKTQFKSDLYNKMKDADDDADKLRNLIFQEADQQGFMLNPKALENWIWTKETTDSITKKVLGYRVIVEKAMFEEQPLKTGFISFSIGRALPSVSKEEVNKAQELLKNLCNFSWTGNEVILGNSLEEKYSPIQPVSEVVIEPSERENHFYLKSRPYTVSSDDEGPKWTKVDITSDDIKFILDAFKK